MVDQNFTEQNYFQRDLFLLDRIAIEYMKAYVTAEPTIGYYDIAHRSYDFAKCFLEVRQQHINRNACLYDRVTL